MLAKNYDLVGIEDLNMKAMSRGLKLGKATIDNHKAYVQSWIEAVRDKPDSLIKAIKDAQSAVNYMDLKAGLITEKEYEKVKDSVMEVKVGKSREMER